MHSQDIKKRVLNFIRNGGSKAEAARLYEVSVTAIYRWLNQPKNHVPGKTGPKTGYILDWDKLRAMVEAHPDFQQKEWAQHFDVSIGAIHNAMKAMGFLRKKDLSLRAKSTRESQRWSVSSGTGEASGDPNSHCLCGWNWISNERGAHAWLALSRPPDPRLPMWS